jgi:hypothetical protein
MKTVFSLIIIITAFFCGCRTTKPSPEICLSVRTGHFVRHLYNSSGLGHWTHVIVQIDRTEKEQVQRLDYTMTTTIYKMEWLDACDYKLTILKPKTWADSVFVKMYPKGEQHRIKSVTSDYVLEKVSGSTDTLWFRK